MLRIICDTQRYITLEKGESLKENCYTTRSYSIAHWALIIEPLCITELTILMISDP
jgi:hypothetical protein